MRSRTLRPHCVRTLRRLPLRCSNDNSAFRSITLHLVSRKDLKSQPSIAPLAMSQYTGNLHGIHLAQLMGYTNPSPYEAHLAPEFPFVNPGDPNHVPPYAHDPYPEPWTDRGFTEDPKTFDADPFQYSGHTHASTCPPLGHGTPPLSSPEVGRSQSAPNQWNGCYHQPYTCFTDAQNLVLEGYPCMPTGWGHGNFCATTNPPYVIIRNIFHD